MSSAPDEFDMLLVVLDMQIDVNPRQGKVVKEWRCSGGLNKLIVLMRITKSRRSFSLAVMILIL